MEGSAYIFKKFYQRTGFHYLRKSISLSVILCLPPSRQLCQRDTWSHKAVKEEAADRNGLENLLGEQIWLHITVGGACIWSFFFQMDESTILIRLLKVLIILYQPPIKTNDHCFRDLYSSPKIVLTEMKNIFKLSNAF